MNAMNAINQPIALIGIETAEGIEAIVCRNGGPYEVGRYLLEELNTTEQVKNLIQGEQAAVVFQGKDKGFYPIQENAVKRFTTEEAAWQFAQNIGAEYMYIFVRSGYRNAMYFGDHWTFTNAEQAGQDREGYMGIFNIGVPLTENRVYTRREIIERDKQYLKETYGTQTAATNAV